MQKKNIRSLLVVSILTFSFLIQIPIAPVRATAPTVVNTMTASVCVSTTVCNFSTFVPATGIVAGNMLIVEAQAYTCTAGLTLTLAMSDSRGNTWSTAVSGTQTALCGANKQGVSYIFYTTIASTFATDTLTLTVSGCSGAQCSELIFEAEQVSGVTVLGNTGTGSACSTTSYSTTSTSFDSNSDFLAGSLMSSAGSSVPGSGFTIIHVLNSYMSGEYAASGVGSPTTFPFTSPISGCGVDVGAAFGAAPVVIGTITIGPCTFFNLQCWWYPLLFMGAYSGILLLVASMLKTSSRGKAHIFLSAVTFGSLIAVVLGIMNIVFPLIMLVINTVIALRLRG